ncbi:MAG: 2-amino-4-hydroxy-6-hydroxymethyldihydropteridine diphosphokinase [Planctomycetia bacterium]|nr:2-amino-4-hydroxy-6-hydroxymethyldihydropteridine diphosphokinase [Planctomycetia bacterium]
MTTHKREVNAVIAYGSNVGDTRRYIQLALEMTANMPETILARHSALRSTFPVKVNATPTTMYSNAVALVSTTLEPLALLAQTQKIENQLGRVRTGFWSERTVDLDIILYGDLISWSPELIIPHPRVYWRDFVLSPACEIVPNMLIPTSQRTFAQTRTLMNWGFTSFPLVSQLIRRPGERLS